jgi:hypothetical protein
VLRALAAILLPILLGLAVLRALGARPAGFAAACAWTYVAGALATAAVMLALALVPLPLASAPTTAALVAAGAAAMALVRRQGSGVAAPAAAGAGSRSVLFAMGIAAALVVAAAWILGANAAPVVTGDEAWNWNVKAKLVWAAGGLRGAEDPRALPVPFGLHLDYPMLNPLLQVWVFAHAEAVTHVVNRLPVQLALPAAILMTSAMLLRWAPPALAGLAGLVLLAWLQANGMPGDASSDVLVVLGVAALLDAWQRTRAGERGAAGLCALALAWLAWSKVEGTFLFAIAAAALAADARLRAGREGARGSLVAAATIVPAALLVACQAWINHAHGWRNDMFAQLSTGASRLYAELGPRIAGLGRFWAGEILFGLGSGRLALGAGLLLLATHARRVLREGLVPAALLVLGLALYLAVFALTPYELDWHLETAACRVVTPLVPAALAVCAIALGRDEGRQE